MRRCCLTMLGALIVLFTLGYILDWTVLQIRERSGSAHGTVIVNSSYVIHQKSGKIEYLYDPPQSTLCVQSLLPHQSQPACWWLASHTEQQKVITAN